MLDMNALRSILTDIYGFDDNHLLPLNNNLFVPTLDKTDLVGTFIGYRIMEKKPSLRAYGGPYTHYPAEMKVGQEFITEIECKFRLSFIGPQAEELADQTLLWDIRDDVRQAFEKHVIQINYIKRRMWSYPVREGGFNDNMCWLVDFETRTAYSVETKWPVWGQ